MSHPRFVVGQRAMNPSYRDTRQSQSAQVRPSMSRRRSGLSLLRRVIRDENDLAKAVTSAGFTLGATAVVLLAWWLS